MNAISYFTSSDARQGKYGRRPNVEIPENTESAFDYQHSSTLTSINIPGSRHPLEGCYTKEPCGDLGLEFGHEHDHHVQQHWQPARQQSER